MISQRLLFLLRPFKMPLLKCIVGFVCFFATSSMAQTAGDYRSKASGDWGDFATWQVYNGTIWVDAVTGQVPGGTSEADANNVYLEAAFTVTLTSDAACKNLHLNTTADVVRINTQNNSLNVWGKMRFYEGIAPGAGTPATVTSSGILGWITTGASGFIRFRGTVNRIIMVQGEVNANNSNSGWNLDFAFDSGIIGELNDRIRMGTLTVTSGELFVNNYNAELRVGTNSPGDITPNGTALIKSGAAIRGGGGIFKNGTTAAQSITVENGATLVVTRSNYVLAAVNLDLAGTVVIEDTGTITFPTPLGRGGAAVVNTFNNLTLDGTGTTTKRLQNNVTVSGTLKMAGTASLTLNTYVLSYGANGTLEYNGSVAQTTSNAEFPIVNGPNNLTINNSNGVALHASRTLAGQLTLTNGLFSLGVNHFTLGASSPAVAGSLSENNMIVTNDTGELRKIFNTPGSFLYPIGEMTGDTDYSYGEVNVTSADVLDATTYIGLRVINTSHAAAASATDRLSRYWNVNSNMANINYDVDLHYAATDVIGAEATINTYNYSDETALAMGTPLVRIDATLNRIAVSGLTSGGFITGANFCAIANNTISYTGATEFCNAATLTESFTGSVATVTSPDAMYQWQQKINTGSWTDISSADAQDYTELASLTPTTIYSYRRAVSDPAYCLVTDVNYSNEISINVYPGISSNQIEADQSVLDGATPDPFTQVGTLTGGTGTYIYQWQSATTMGGPYTDIALENNATYNAPAGSTATFYVRKVTSGECSSTSNEVSISIVTATVSEDVMSGVQLYPNPVNSDLVFNLDLSAYKNVEVSIVNSMGSTVYKKKVNPVSNFTIDLSSQVNGIYFAHLVVDGGKSAVYKVVKQ